MYLTGVSRCLCYLEQPLIRQSDGLALLGALAMQVYIYATAFYRSDRIYMQATGEPRPYVVIAAADALGLRRI